MKKLISIVLLSMLILGGCGNQEKKNDKMGETSNSETVKTIDTMNGEIKINEVPQNVVSLDLMYTEILVSLGIEPVGTVTPLNDEGEFPYYVREQLDEANTKNLGEEADLEVIKTLNPDLIIATEEDQENYEELSNIAPTLIIDQRQEEHNDWQENMMEIAPIFEVEDQSQEVIDTYETKVQEVNGEISSTFNDTSTTGMYIDVTGESIKYIDESFLYNSLTFTKPDSVVIKSQEQELTAEELVKINPDFLIIGTKTRNDIQALVEENEDLLSLSAYESSHYYEVDPELWNFGFGPLSEELKLNQIEEFIVNQ